MDLDAANCLCDLILEWQAKNTLSVSIDWEEISLCMTKKEFSLTSNECRALWRKIAYNSEDCDADSSVDDVYLLPLESIVKCRESEDATAPKTSKYMFEMSKQLQRTSTSAIPFVLYDRSVAEKSTYDLSSSLCSRVVPRCQPKEMQKPKKRQKTCYASTQPPHREYNVTLPPSHPPRIKQEQLSMPPPIARTTVSASSATNAHAVKSSLEKSTTPSYSSNVQSYAASTSTITPQSIPDAIPASSPVMSAQSQHLNTSYCIRNESVISCQHTTLPKSIPTTSSDVVKAKPLAMAPSIRPQPPVTACMTSVTVPIKPKPFPYASYHSVPAAAINYSQHLHPQMPSAVFAQVSQPMPSVINRPLPSGIPIAPFPSSQLSLQQLCRTFPHQRYSSSGAVGAHPGAGPSSQTIHTFQPKFPGQVSPEYHTKINDQSSGMCSQPTKSVPN